MSSRLNHKLHIIIWYQDNLHSWKKCWILWGYYGTATVNTHIDNYCGLKLYSNVLWAAAGMPYLVSFCYKSLASDVSSLTVNRRMGRGIRSLELVQKEALLGLHSRWSQSVVGCVSDRPQAELDCPLPRCFVSPLGIVDMCSKGVTPF